MVAAALALALLAVACEAVPSDYTGDRTSDLVYRNPLTGYWYQVAQSAPIFQDQGSGSIDVPAPGDYNGDGKWEPAVMRGTTWISSALSTPITYDPVGLPAGPAATPAGLPGGTPPTLIPVPGDYDGTGRTVPAYYDEVDGSWWIMGHSGSVQFGIPPTAGGNQGYDVAVPADYDGDGRTDIAVYRPTDSSFHYLSSKSGSEVSIQLGRPGDEPIPGDYDGVGHAEAATADNRGGTWYVAGHDGVFASLSTVGSVGPATSLPMLGDYNGDAKMDPAVMSFDPPGTPTGQNEGQMRLSDGTVLATFALDMFPRADVELAPGIVASWDRVQYYGLCLTQPYYC